MVDVKNTQVRPKDALVYAGKALYGERWQSDLARALNYEPRRIRQWLAGVRPVPQGIVEKLDGLLVARQEEIDEVLRRLREPVSGDDQA